MQIILPKVLHSNTPSADKLFFLAGPIRGGDDWQAKVAELFAQRTANPLIACPCRWDENHQLSRHFVKGKAKDVFARQLDWERFYLETAGLGNKDGCVVFWLPCESKTKPHPGPEPYAMDTRGELGEWRARMKFQAARVVVGAEEGFLGLSQIQRNFSLMLGYDFPIYSSMEKTVDAAIAMSASRR